MIFDIFEVPVSIFIVNIDVLHQPNLYISEEIPLCSIIRQVTKITQLLRSKQIVLATKMALKCLTYQATQIHVNIQGLKFRILLNTSMGYQESKFGILSENLMYHIWTYQDCVTTIVMHSHPHLIWALPLTSTH